MVGAHLLVSSMVKDNIKEKALIEITGPKGEDIMMGEAQ